MVTKFRNAGKSLVGRIVIGIFFGIIALSFALWGIGDIFRGDTNPVVATVGKSEIKVADLEREFNNNVNMLTRRFGQEITPAQAMSMGMLNSSLDQLINQRLLDEEAADLGMGVSDTAIITRIQQNPAFHDATGKYNADSLRTRLRSAGVSEAEFIQSQKITVLWEQLYGSIGAAAFGSDAALDLIARYDSEKRGMDWVVIPADAAIATPEDSELEEYLAGDSGKQFERPEYRGFDIIQLTAADVVTSEDYTEADVLAEYEAVKASLGTPEQRRIDQISFADEAAAVAALNRIQGGEDFAAVAKDTAGLNEDEISLGLVEFKELPEGYARAAFSLAANTVSAPVNTALGWRLFRVTEIIPGNTPTFEEVRTTIEQRLIEPIASDRFYEFTKDIEDRLAGGETLKEIGSALTLGVDSYAGLSATGEDINGSANDSLAARADILRTLFTTELETDSGVIETDSGVLYALVVTDITEATLPALSDIREEVLAAWVKEEQAIAAETRANAVVEAVNNGQPLVAAVRDFGLTVGNSNVVTRYESLGETVLDNAILARLFAADKNTAFSAPATDGSRVVGVVSVVERGQALANKDARDVARDRLNQALRNDIIASFSGSLNGKHNVAIKQAVITRYFSGGSNHALQ